MERYDGLIICKRLQCQEHNEYEAKRRSRSVFKNHGTKALGNDSKGGWLSQTDAYLLKRLHQEVEELVTELKSYYSLNIQRECADVANIAMMISDKRRRK